MFVDVNGSLTSPVSFSKICEELKILVKCYFLAHRNIIYTVLCTCICQTRQLCTDFVVLCKIFEHSAVQVDPVIEFIQLRSTPFKDSTILAPKLAERCFWRKSNSTPSKSGSGLPDPDQLICCTISRCLLDEIQYLETRSRYVNMSFIIVELIWPHDTNRKQTRQ